MEMAVEENSLCVEAVRAVTGRQKTRSVSGMKHVRQRVFVMASLVVSAKGFWMKMGKLNQTRRSGRLSSRRHSVGLTGLVSVPVWCKCRRCRG
jgi:hypothetical protein